MGRRGRCGRERGRGVERREFERMRKAEGGGGQRPMSRAFTFALEHQRPSPFRRVFLMGMEARQATGVLAQGADLQAGAPSESRYSKGWEREPCLPSSFPLSTAGTSRSKAGHENLGLRQWDQQRDECLGKGILIHVFLVIDHSFGSGDTTAVGWLGFWPTSRPRVTRNRREESAD